MNHDDKLYIYYVEGNVTHQDEKEFGSHYMGNWKEGDSSFLFFTTPSYNLVKRLVQSRDNLRLVDHFEFKYKDWQDQISAPLRIGRIDIVPAWYDVGDKTRYPHLIRIDPGVVFGSGLHPTTRDCIRAIQNIKDEISKRVVLDLGTGSGILSMACALMGAKIVVGVDINPLAVKTARRNVSLNNMEKNVMIVLGDALTTISIPSDIIIANLNYAVLKRIIVSEDFSKRRYAIFSGLLRSDERELRDIIREMGYEILNTWDHEFTWFTLLIKIYNS